MKHVVLVKGREMDKKPKYLTVKAVIEALSQFPDDAEVWGYEGEVCGVIVSDGKRTGILHNYGKIEIKDG